MHTLDLGINNGYHLRKRRTFFYFRSVQFTVHSVFSELSLFYHLFFYHTTVRTSSVLENLVDAFTLFLQQNDLSVLCSGFELPEQSMLNRGLFLPRKVPALSPR